MIGFIVVFLVLGGMLGSFIIGCFFVVFDGIIVFGLLLVFVVVLVVLFIWLCWVFVL